MDKEGFIARILHYCAFSGTAFGEFHPPFEHYTPPPHQQMTVFDGLELMNVA